jgi:hypothetical protein
MTRPNGISERDEDGVATALSALAWTLADARRADRLLGVTGLSPDALRARALEPALLAAVLQFLEGHEPDLIACAEALGRSPADLIRIRSVLES